MLREGSATGCYLPICWLPYMVFILSILSILFIHSEIPNSISNTYSRQLSSTKVLERMENVGTPIGSDNDRDRVVRHLEAEGGIQLQQRLAPRVLVRGRYQDEGGNVKLHVGRLHSSGTYLCIKLTIGENKVLDVFRTSCTRMGWKEVRRRSQSMAVWSVKPWLIGSRFAGRGWVLATPTTSMSTVM